MDQDAAAIARPACVISLDAHRRTRRVRRRRLHAAQPLVAIWFAAAATSVAIALSALMSLGIRHGALGVGLLIALASVITWKPAGSFLARYPIGSRDRDAARARHPAGNRSQRPQR